MNTHKCPVGVCQIDVDADKLMCVTHWHMVPRSVQKILYSTWRNGKGVGTTEHVAAMRACVRAVESWLAEAARDGGNARDQS